MSLLSQFKDIFGDGTYGDGFLLACLDHYGNNTERAINALLEGSLPPALQKLDPMMPAAARPSAAGPGPSSSSSSTVGPSSSSAGPSSSRPAAAAPQPQQQDRHMLWLAAYAGLEPLEEGGDGGGRTHGVSSSSSQQARRPLGFQSPAYAAAKAQEALGKKGGRGADTRTAKLLDAASNQVKRAALRLADLIERTDMEYDDE